MSKSIRILLIEDSEDDADLLLRGIRRGGYDLVHTRVDTEETMRAALASSDWDIVISDYSMPQFTGLAALEIAKLHDPDLPFIIVSGNIGEEIAVEAMRAGARDYVTKAYLTRLVPAIERELREAAARSAGRTAQLELQENEARLQALFSNIPGVVLQLIWGGAGGSVFPYVSNACKPLLELTPQELRDDPARFFALLTDDESAEFTRQMTQSAQDMSAVNWEGRIRTPVSGTIKWVNVRLIPRRIESDVVQWEGIMMNVSQRRQAEAEIMHSRQQLSELSSHLQSAKELERTRVAREVHDDIGGNLTAIKIDLLWLGNRLERAARGARGRKGELLEKVASLVELTDRTMEITSRIAHDLRPPLLDLGLLAAMEWESNQFQKRMEIPCTINCPNEDMAVDPELASALFSVFRETLTNISKHARATKVNVDLYADGPILTLRVTDDGAGIVESDLHKRGSFGLRGMAERVRHLCGKISFEGAPGRGTTITATLPLVPVPAFAGAASITGAQAP